MTDERTVAVLAAAARGRGVLVALEDGAGPE